ncbi:alpha,alpha-trehalose-phosphate synthase [Microbotryum lychnidis-dioicae p1A1 Lamole]|uniref:alpha,alpha-trehalose-phosphate synthase (UDP-forming) n=2 Tax=Microbotryum lychnidis-dioicae (strain p1A1 Lamole / MvSl-1064) TaxID=683840 RepID=U5H3R9_USTV1|nr:alpha,alpha-trehalose-phosphate synthase [Microbotryum lychnidis-dioicae p1A1 Lamole]|eukprot:KDE07702.1 alpha,alpha-trehalose-phosphate synthase [Microbotryum lychnidis-dioicae p1A1 Lamole]
MVTEQRGRPGRIERQRSCSSEAAFEQKQRSSGSQLIVVANRLPVSVIADPTAEGGYRFVPSSGGLASALSGCKKRMDFVWIGWPGFDVPEVDRDFITKKLQTEFSCSPVYLSAEVAERYYNGFSNSILWPLFHYHPGEMSFDETDWLAYRQANLLFAEAVQKLVQSGDIVWVQDYHLCLVPLFLRDLLGRSPASMGEDAQGSVAGMFQGLTLGPQAASPRPGSEEPTGVNGTHSRTVISQVQIGFFLHTPFPSSEVFRVLPVRREILLGMLNCDLIGFHTYDYARHFLSSVSRLLGLRSLPNRVELVGRHATVGTFPIGIEPSTFFDCLSRDSVVQRIAALRRRFEGVKIIVGVDRLDYIKGVPQKLLAMEEFLDDNPEWIGKVVLVQVAVPSRQDVEEYQNLRASVNELVGRINGRFGTVEFMPIHFMHRSIPFEELTALYAVSDACLITSTRDGMNLVAYEYVACQQERHGVLILSEFAGAAHSLNGSLIVNPWNTGETAAAINRAMTMDTATRQKNHSQLFRYVSKYTAAHWGTEFVAELMGIAEKADADSGFNPSVPDHVRRLTQKQLQ